MVSLCCTSTDDCPVCLGALANKKVFITPCGHVWHLSCHHKLKSHGVRKCCMCRKRFRPRKAPAAPPPLPEFFPPDVWAPIHALLESASAADSEEDDWSSYSGTTVTTMQSEDDDDEGGDDDSLTEEMSMSDADFYFYQMLNDDERLAIEAMIEMRA